MLLLPALPVFTLVTKNWIDARGVLWNGVAYGNELEGN